MGVTKGGIMGVPSRCSTIPAAIEGTFHGDCRRYLPERAVIASPSQQVSRMPHDERWYRG